MNNLQLHIEATRPEDAQAILAITEQVGVFNAEEIATVDELLVEYFGLGPAKSGYYFLTGRVGEQVVSFACYGPRALTSGTFDFYWLATDKNFGGRGIGGAMAQRVVQEVKAMGGRLIIIETSGRPDYAQTRHFHETHNYIREAIIVDFYAPGDDLVIYVQRV